jgi:hypothetical protein
MPTNNSGPKNNGTATLLCRCAACGRPVQTYWPPTFQSAHELLCLACDPAAPKDRKR